MHEQITNLRRSPRPLTSLTCCFASMALLALGPVRAGHAQQGAPTLPSTHNPGVPGLNEPETGPAFGANRLERMREDERRKRLLADTAKLVALSNQLNDAVSKTPKDELSLEVVRKAEEIEKLAHDVKEHMKS